MKLKNKFFIFILLIFIIILISNFSLFFNNKAKMNDLSVIKYNNINELKKTNNNLDYYLDEVIADFYENNNKKSIIYA